MSTLPTPRLVRPGRASTPLRARPDRSEQRRTPGIVMPFLVRELVCTLSGNQFLVWTVMFLLKRRNNLCRVKNETLELKCGISKVTLDEAKRVLIKKGWLKNLGQYMKGANRYEVTIPIPREVKAFIHVLHDVLEKEPWYDEVFARKERAEYPEEDLDITIALRSVRALLSASEGAWQPGQKIPKTIAEAALKQMLETLRGAATAFVEGDSIFELWGDAYQQQLDISRREAP